MTHNQDTFGEKAPVRIETQGTGQKNKIRQRSSETFVDLPLVTQPHITRLTLTQMHIVFSGLYILLYPIPKRAFTHSLPQQGKQRRINSMALMKG